MKTRTTFHARRGTLLAMALTGLLAARAGAQDAGVRWRGADRTVDEFAKTSPAAAEVARQWQPFARAHPHRLVASDDARLLLILGPRWKRVGTEREDPKVTRLIGLLAETTKCVEPLVGLAANDVAPPVLVAAREADYEAVLQHIAKLDPRLAEWATTAGRNVTGCILSEPLVAAWIDDAKGQQEWNDQNELVHRAAQLLLRRQADQLPAWFALGFGWHVEDTVLHTIYCFPHRSGFVWATEHTGWDRRLANRFRIPSRPATAEQVSIDGLARWEPITSTKFDPEMACLAFGVVRFLAQAHPEKLLSVARAFDAEIEEKWRVQISETEWRTDPGYRIPPARQLELLDAAVPGFREACTGWLRDGDSKSPRKRR